MKTTLSLTQSGMDEVVLLLHGLMKLVLVAVIMVLVATAPSRASTPNRDLQVGPGSGADEDDTPESGRRRLSADEDSRWMDGDDHSPVMNLDGTPMSGDLDIAGNFFGDCGQPSIWDD